MTTAPRDPNAPNWLGVRTLYLREVRRFMKVFSQTLMAPVITTLLFFAVFAVALGNAVKEVYGVPFLEFLAPGLIMMGMVQNAFANTSSSLMISKMQGNIVDTLMPPLTATELTAALSLGGATRGICVGLAIGIVLSVIVDKGIHNIFYIVFFAFSASLMLALIGIAGGIWAEKFDHISAVTNFIVTPLSFLSGTFYSIERLPEYGQFLAHINPFFYMIDGFRYGFIGASDSNPLIGVAVMSVINIGLWIMCVRMFATGYKLKA